MPDFINRLRSRVAAFIDPGLIDSLEAQLQARDSALQTALGKLWNLRDALDHINENARAGALPEGKFLQLDYGRGGLVRETVITADAVRHAGSGLHFVADGPRVVVQDPHRRKLFELTKDRLTWPNGLKAIIG